MFRFRRLKVSSWPPPSFPLVSWPRRGLGLGLEKVMAQGLKRILVAVEAYMDARN